MSNAFKNTYLAVAGLLISSATQLNATDCSTSSCEPCINPGPSPCCSPRCLPSPYCSPNCIPVPYCNEVRIQGELLYWTADLCGLETAFGSTTIATTVAEGITTTTVTEKDKEPDWQWRPGFRVGADYAFTCFIVEADWTHYQGRAKFHDEDQHGSWKIKYDTLDLLFGRRCCVAPCFYFKPFIGVRGALIHQKLYSELGTLFTAIIGNSTVATLKDDKERFWGVAPELGLEADWYIGCKWSMYASFDFVTYYGKIKSHIYNTDIFTSTVSISDGKVRRSFHMIGTDGSIGFRWDKAWPVASEVLLTFKIGVEQHRIYDFSELGSDGTLSLAGANLATSLGYRF